MQLFEADKRSSQAGSYIVLDGTFGDATTTAYAETAGLSIVGSFTATETSIWFTISKVLPPTEGGAQVNAYQLRDVTNTATANPFSKLSFTAYPNPVNDVISVKGLEQGTYRATIYSLTGSNCLSTQLKGNQNSIAINQLPAGTYLLNVVGGNLNVTKKFDKR